MAQIHTKTVTLRGVRRWLTAPLVVTGDILGRAGGPNASLSGADTTGQIVAYTSDYLTFIQPGNSYNLSLANINPVLSVGPGGFLNSFVANVNGQFSAMLVAVPA